MIDPASPQWERAVLEKVALEAIREQRRTRQWNALHGRRSSRAGT